MSEDPKTTLMNLIKDNISLTKDDGVTAATVHVSHEWFNSRLFKNCDAQITVGLQDSKVKALNLARSHLLYIDTYRIVGWSIDKPGVTGKEMRWKIRKEIERIIQENSKAPGGELSFIGVTPPISEGEDVNAKPPYWMVQVTVMTYRFQTT